VQLRSLLEQQKLGSKLALFDAQETLQNQRTSLTELKGKLAESTAAFEVLERDAEKAVHTFVADNAQKAAEAERKSEEDNERLAKAHARTEHMTLRAPVSGIVQGLTITSTGQVMMPAEEVMRIVPDGSSLEVECYVANKDIGFISAGQQAIVKVESFPFTQYGVLDAKVVEVGRDAIPEQDISREETDPAKSQKAIFTGGGERTQNLYFPVVLTPQRTYVGNNEALEISNGMSATVEIKTGRRRIIDYLLSPLVEVGSRALKER
jgi:hemolysin D